MLIIDAEIEGRPARSLRIEGDRIATISDALTPRPGERVVDAQGGALLPGLHDHHIHLQAAARAAESVRCGPPSVIDSAGLVSALEGARKNPPGQNGWIRGVAYHESVAGELDAERLDRWVPDRPLRIQHRTGALWMLNTAALSRIDQDPANWPDGAERDATGQPTGRFFRLDGWLRDRLGAAVRPGLGELSRRLAARGVTGVTDATPNLDDADAAYFGAEIDSGALRQRCVLMGSESLAVIDHPHIERGALKIMLDEPALPDLDALSHRMRAAHASGRAVAVHCATRVELAVACTALREAGVQRGDRIEHASVAPDEWVEVIADLGLAVVTQPHFVYERGDIYLVDVEASDRPWLYRGRAWLDAGVPLAAGSDAPYGEPDPWRSMKTAVSRRTRSDRSIGADEGLTPEDALALFTSDPMELGGSKRKIEPGAMADLALLDGPWAAVRGCLDTARVALTVRGGDVIHAIDASLAGDASHASDATHGGASS